MFEVIQYKHHSPLEKVQTVGMCYLEDGVHGDRQWAIPGILRDLKDVNTPSVYILHLLPVDNKHKYMSLQHTAQGEKKTIHTDRQLLN